jgi:hypothetical protein
MTNFNHFSKPITLHFGASVTPAAIQDSTPTEPIMVSTHVKSPLFGVNITPFPTHETKD